MHAKLLLTASLLMASTAAFAENPTGIVGENLLSVWQGEYQVTQCLECASAVVASGQNMKNFVSFSLGNSPLNPAYSEGCDDVDTLVWFAYKFETPAIGSEEVAHDAGRCDWGYDEYLVATADSYTYRSYGQNPEKETMTLSVAKQADGQVLIDLKVSSPTPSWGYPATYELKALAKKLPPRS